MDRNTDYPHDGVISWDDPFWQTIERDLTNEDYARQGMTAAEYDAYLVEVDRQDAFAADGMHDRSPEEQEAWMVAHGLAQPGDLLGYIPEAPGEDYYETPIFDCPEWQEAVEQAEEGNYLDPITS